MKKFEIGNSSIESIGIGLTSFCNLRCPHCYSRRLDQGTLNLADVRRIVKKFPNLRAVNFGTGESIFAPDLFKVILFLKKKKIKIALTSNSTTVKNLSDAFLKKFSDVDISLDFPNGRLHDAWRDRKGLFKEACAALVRCKKMGIDTSIALALMNINFKYLPAFKKLIDKYGVYLRINLYKPTETQKYLLSYRQFWQAVRLMAKYFQVVSCSEPILAWYFQNNSQGSPCGSHSVRIHPDMEITPCVYLPASLRDHYFYIKKNIPSFCRQCLVKNNCRGGCLGRRLLEKREEIPDEYCPLYRGYQFPEIKFNLAQEKEFVHSGYLCTIILK